MIQTEIWKEIKGYEGMYSISNQGRVKNLNKSKMMKLTRSVNIQGCVRMKVNLSKSGVLKTFTISTLVANHFLGKQHGMVQFKDGDPTNCRADNIMIVRATNRFRSAHSKAVKNNETGEVHESITSLSKRLGVTPEAITMGLRDSLPKYRNYSYVSSEQSISRG
ncbi:NUMOD4 domain-containing protein [Parapedobacter indicus]|uniref:NUMOD4 motif-containing protein n=1 Tax=Parapedobacter indicus TaxID=1477437 RepID=A0A1I3E4F8_9SPHI|nr:NUMOD4 motif-containing protein [Parapedobacter indicus]SFH93870.1 NUMOD4 motif-containing protein [Parapedobacter indicus]